MEVLKSYLIRNASKENIDTILNSITYSENKEVGRGIISGRYSSIILGEDEVVSCIGYSDGESRKFPSCISKLLNYIRTLYEEDFRISSVSIYEGSRDDVIFDIVNAETHEVYGYRFWVKGDRVVYDDYVPESSIPTSYHEQYFPYVESEDPDSETISKLMYKVLEFCGNFNFPIKRVVITSEGDDLFTVGKKCRYGVGNSKNYYGLLGYEEGNVYDVYDMGCGEYDLCILVEK